MSLSYLVGDTLAHNGALLVGCCARLSTLHVARQTTLLVNKSSLNPVIFELVFNLMLNRPFWDTPRHKFILLCPFRDHHVYCSMTLFE